MVTLLFISFSVLVLLLIAVFLWQKSTSLTKTESLPTAPGGPLFPEGTPTGLALAAAAAEAQATNDARRFRIDLFERAESGDKSALQEGLAKSNDLYSGVMQRLLTKANSTASVLALASYVTRHDLPVTKALADRFIESCSAALDRGTVAKVLHIAALADDATVYQNALETTMDAWRKGELPDVSPNELRSILEGEFWILSRPTRNSGAGFLLKRALASTRRELARGE